jgi:hypothetical protein
MGVLFSLSLLSSLLMLYSYQTYHQWQALQCSNFCYTPSEHWAILHLRSITISFWLRTLLLIFHFHTISMFNRRTSVGNQATRDLFTISTINKIITNITESPFLKILLYFTFPMHFHPFLAWLPDEFCFYPLLIHA